MLRRRSQVGLIKTLISKVVLCACFAFPIKTLAQDEVDWWFDVEVIAFERTGNDSQISEDFSKAMFDLNNTEAVDLLTPALSKLYESENQLNNLPICKTPHLVEIEFNENLNIVSIPELPSFSISTVEQSDTIAPLGKDTTLTNLADTTSTIPETNIADDSRLLFEEIEEAQLISNIYPISEQIYVCETFKFNDYEQALFELGMLDHQYEFRNINDLIDTTPRRYDLKIREFDRHHYILPDGNLKLMDYAAALYKQRNVRTLLHTSWRQPVVFEEENAAYYRVFAGNRLRYEAKELGYEALLDKYGTSNDIAQEETQNDALFFKRLKASLASPDPIDWASIEKIDNSVESDQEQLEIFDGKWELDGQIKVYLRYINRIPYLHLDNEFMLNKLDVSVDGHPVLKQFPFKQRRRIISKQIHYFDHPKFGLIVRLERFEPPKESSNEEQE